MTKRSPSVSDISWTSSSEALDDSDSSWTKAETEDTSLKSKIILIRCKIFILLEKPNSGRWALAISVANMVLITISTLFFLLESLPEYHNSDSDFWATSELVFIIAFTIDFTLRLLCCTSLKKFVKKWLNWIDLLAILPFYLELALESDDVAGSRVVRIVRLARVLRILKISRYTQVISNILYQTVASSLGVLGMVLLTVFLVMTFYASLIFFFERGDWKAEEGNFFREGEQVPSPFRSIPHSLWWGITTMTTVGYGDDVPISGQGKLIASFTTLTGILVIAVPVSVLGANFSKNYHHCLDAEPESDDDLDSLPSDSGWLAARSKLSEKYNIMGEIEDTPTTELIVELDEINAELDKMLADLTQKTHELCEAMALVREKEQIGQRIMGRLVKRLRHYRRAEKSRSIYQRVKRRASLTRPQKTI